MSERTSLYMWAIVPPPEQAHQIDVLRKAFSENYHCYKALKPPVHLTLFTLFQVSPQDIEVHIARFKSWASQQAMFPLSLKGFGFFENPKSPVVFVDVVPNAELKALNSGLSQLNRKLFELDDLSKNPFHPHFTIGYRDVPPASFPEIKRAYSNRLFHATFDVTHISLFRHSGIEWKLQHSLPLGTNHAGQAALW